MEVDYNIAPNDEDSFRNILGYLISTHRERRHIFESIVRFMVSLNILGLLNQETFFVVGDL